MEDSIAESLEQRGLCHCAERLWLSITDAAADEAIRKMIARRREQCLKMAADMPPD
nr:PerC family transcriptional regulator [Pantoea allii]